MFEVLVYVYENYWRGEACPELQQLGRKLSAAGFDADEIAQALQWLDGLNIASHHTELIDIRQSVPEHLREAHNSLRVYPVAEQDRQLPRERRSLVAAHARDRDRPRDGRAGSPDAAR